MRFVRCTVAFVTLVSLSCARSGDTTTDLSPIGVIGVPPAAKVQPVTETLFGVTVTDPYRYMEALDADTLAYMKAEGRQTRAIFDAVAPRAALLKQITDFGASFGFVNSYQTYGGRAFYLERAPGADTFDLVVRQPDGQTRKIVDLAAWRASHDNTPHAINFFDPAWDGSKVAVGISAGGSEDASIYVFDAATGHQTGKPADRAQFGILAWSENNAVLYFTRLARVGPKDPPTNKYKNATVARWDLASDPVDVLGATMGRGPKIAAEQIPGVAIVPKASNAYFLNINGVQNEVEIWSTPIARLSDPATTWKVAIARTDNVTGFDQRGDDLFLLSHQDAPTFKVLQLRAGDPIAAAKTLVPAQPNRVIEGVHAASDALYVRVREGVYSHLLRVPAGTDRVEEVALPFKGIASGAFTDSRAPGLEITMESWNQPPTEFYYNPETKAFADLKLGARPAFDPSQFTVLDLQAKAQDGVMVPLSLVQPKDAKGPQIVLLDAYGSYGISSLPGFSPRAIVLMQQGADTATCHVRGGGELGEAWRLGGKDEKKPNTWRDLIACGEDLIARGITTKDKLFIIGGSAGGITMGRALTERPDLFAGVIDQVPAANTLRSEFSPNGPPNIPEFGSVTTEAGFKNLLEMDSIQHVKDGMQYPAVLITTGLNDPRVSPWEPAKFFARLQASGTKNPVLLRVEDEAGHGIGSTKTQRDEEYADVLSFIFWRAGRAGWRPDLTKK
jgi:prolyl oligopeptidase